MIRPNLLSSLSLLWHHPVFRPVVRATCPVREYVMGPDGKLVEVTAPAEVTP